MRFDRLSVPRPVRLPWGGWWIARRDFLDRALRWKQPYEPKEVAFLQNYLRPGMTFLDLGAHHGYYTLLASRRVGPRGRVIAFEPSFRERRRLIFHAFLNWCRNVRVEPFALGSREAQGELYVVLELQTGCNSLRPPVGTGPTRRVSVAQTTLDLYLERTGIPRVDAMKVDVEGGELEAFRGAAGLLARRPRPVILCEVQEIRTAPWGYRSVEIFDLLTAWGFHWFSLSGDGALTPCERKEVFDDNLVAVPEERLGEFR